MPSMFQPLMQLTTSEFLRLQWVPETQRPVVAAVTIVAVSAATVWLVRRLLGRRRLPPGPRGWPLVGNLELFQESGREAAQAAVDRLAQTYGGMVTVKVGPIRMVLVLQPELVQEGLLSKQMSNRSSGLYSITYATEDMNDIFAAPNNERWRYHRKSTFSAFRVFAQADMLERIVVDSFDSVSKYFADHGAEPKDVYETIYLLTYNLQCRMAFSREYTPDDPEFLWLRESVEYFNQSIQKGLLLDVVPLLRFLPLASNRKFFSTMDGLLAWMRQMCEKRQQSFNPSELNDILDFLIQEQRLATDAGQGHLFQDVHLRQTLLDIFSAGTDTSSMTLYWTVWALCDYPEMQARCYAEIRSVFGDSTPRLSERHRLPYTDAFLHEVMRYWPLAPMIPRECSEDCQLGGHQLPRGTQVMLSTDRCHYNPAAFSEPAAFRPEHFLSPDGKLAPHKRGFLAFGAGTRVCLGESIAKKTTFLTTLLLVQAFEFVQCPEDKGADGFHKNSNMFIVTPRRYKVRVVPRHAG